MQRGLLVWAGGFDYINSEYEANTMDYLFLVTMGGMQLTRCGHLRLN